MQDTKRQPGQREKILEALRSGERTNVELARIGGLRFGGRIHELRQPEHGAHIIIVRPGKTEGEYIYTLQPHASLITASQPKAKPPPAGRPPPKPRQQAFSFLG